MIPSASWTLARDDLSRGHTETDEYARREFGVPNAAWLLSIADGQGPMTEPKARSTDRLFRRFARVILASF